MDKTSKVTKVQSEKTKDGGVDQTTGAPIQLPEVAFSDVYCWLYEFENGDKGKAYTKKPEPPEKPKPPFKYGEEAKYVIEEKTDKNGEKFNKISKPYSKGSYSKGGGSKYTPKKKIAYKADMIGYAFSYAKDLMIADKLPADSNLGNMAILLSRKMWSVLDEIKGLE